MKQRTFLSLLTLPLVAVGFDQLSAFAQRAPHTQGSTDRTIRIGTCLVELVSDTIVSTTTYNGGFPWSSPFSKKMKSVTTKYLLAVSTVLTLSLPWLSNAVAADVATPKSPGIGPTIRVFRGDKCVADTDFMRRNHMDLIVHQSEDTVRRGIRTTKYSLKNCVNCHADPKTNSVLGKNGFCETCHSYTATEIDCFSCHSASPEKEGQVPKKCPSASCRRALGARLLTH